MAAPKVKIIMQGVSAVAQGLIDTLVRPKLEQHFDFVPPQAKPELAPNSEYILCVQNAKREDLCSFLKHAEEAKARCLWVHCFMAGVDSLPTNEIKALKVPVTNAKGCFSSSLGEWIMMAALHFEKQIPRLLENKKQHNYDRYTMGELRGKTMGIIGYGDIGRSCAQLAVAFGMRVVGVKRRPGDNPPGTKDTVGTEVYGMDHREELLKTSDYIIAILPGTPETKHSIILPELKKMKPTAVFMNIGRGITVNEADVVSALHQKIIRGAALDVHEIEPLPKDSEVWDAPNLLLSPHNADLTEEYNTVTVEKFLSFAEQYFLKKVPFPPAHTVDLDLGY